MVNKLGYHPATFGRDLEAFWTCARVSGRVGWDGLEYCGRGLEQYYGSPEPFARRLHDEGLELATIYTGCSFADGTAIREEQETVRRAADFCAAVGAEFLLIDGGRKRDGGCTDRDIQGVARAANEMGEMARERGLTCCWHQHWGTMFEYPPAFHRLMQLTDPELVRFTPDTAQLALGGFDLPAVFEQYLERIAYVHFKDLDKNRRFIELGRGTVDFAPVWQILKRGGYNGWIVVDLDYTSLPPEESCEINFSFLRERLGINGALGQARLPQGDWT